MTFFTNNYQFIGKLKQYTKTMFDYLLPEITYVNEYHNYNTRAASNNLIVQNKPHCELYRTSLYYKGIQLWNSLPDSIKNVDNLSQFKCKFKNYLCMSP